MTYQINHLICYINCISMSLFFCNIEINNIKLITLTDNNFFFFCSSVLLMFGNVIFQL